MLEDIKDLGFYAFVDFLRSAGAIIESKKTAPLVNKHYQNEVTLIGQSLPLKCCQPLEILTHFIMEVEL